LQFDGVPEGRKQDGSRAHPTSRNQITNRASVVLSTFCTSLRMAERMELISPNRAMSLRESVSSTAPLHSSLKRSILCAGVAMVIVSSFLFSHERMFGEQLNTVAYHNERGRQAPSYARSNSCALNTKSEQKRSSLACAQVYDIFFRLTIL